VNYEGAFFTDDTDKYNTYETDRFEDAVDILKMLIQCGFEDAYLKDEDYQCALHWDKTAKEFYWN
jgi:hypothetical protein